VQVGRDGLDRLGEVDGDAGPGAEPAAEDPLGHVAQRQVGQHAVAGRRRRCGEAAALDQFLDGEVDVRGGQHHALRRAGRAGGVDQGHHVVRPGLVHPPGDRVRVPGAMFGAEGKEVRPGDQPRVVVPVPDAAGFDVHDALEVGQVVDRERLVDLLLVLGDQNLRARVP
jgi:hypothetical protein